MPSNAKKVFQGEIFEVWQWEQKMFDGSVAIFERLKRPNTAQVIAIVGDKILIATQEQPDKKPFPSLFGGRCEDGEDSLATAKRELLEESGYISDDWFLWKEQNPVGKIEWTVHTYIARNCVFQQPPKLDSGEKIETHLLDFEEFLMLSEDQTFYEGELSKALLRTRFDQEFKREFRQLLFGK